MSMRAGLRSRGSRLIESLLAFAIISVGIVFLRIVHGTPPPFGDPKDIGSAAFFPGMVALMVTGLGMVLMILTWRPRFSVTFESGNTTRALVAYVLMVAMVVSIRFLGIWLATMLAVPLLALCFGERRWYVLLVLAVVPPGLVIHIFEGVMGVYFPKGMLL